MTVVPGGRIFLGARSVSMHACFMFAMCVHIPTSNGPSDANYHAGQDRCTVFRVGYFIVQTSQLRFTISMSCGKPSAKISLILRSACLIEL